MEGPVVVDQSTVHNRPDEWKIEQGLAGAKLPFLDQTGHDQVYIQPAKWPNIVQDEEAIKSVGDPNVLFAREIEGWKGYAIDSSFWIDRERH